VAKAARAAAVKEAMAKPSPLLLPALQALPSTAVPSPVQLPQYQHQHRRPLALLKS
jgi:hypothetical protein